MKVPLLSCRGEGHEHAAVALGPSIAEASFQKYMVLFLQQFAFNTKFA